MTQIARIQINNAFTDTWFFLAPDKDTELLNTKLTSILSEKERTIVYGEEEIVTDQGPTLERIDYPQVSDTDEDEITAALFTHICEVRRNVNKHIGPPSIQTLKVFTSSGDNSMLGRCVNSAIKKYNVEIHPALELEYERWVAERHGGNQPSVDINNDTSITLH